MALDKFNANDYFKHYMSIIKEFIKALAKSHTYDIRKNGYLIFGILWGIPVPIVTIGIGIYYKDLLLSLHNIIAEIINNPLHFFFLLHPLLFGIVFGAMGTVRHQKEEDRLAFEKSLVDINQKLKYSNERLKELDQLKDNFLSMVSHELWSPLTTVQGYISFIKEEKIGPLTAEQKDTLAIAEEQIEHLNYLIEELVDISKIEAGKFEVNLDRISDIAGIETKTVDYLRQTAEKKNIVLKNELPGSLPCVWADRRRITQVFTNLLTNAIKFTPENGRVKISARETPDKIIFLIEDNGIGISDTAVDKIFDKFYQEDSGHNRKYGGCGLGLAIAKSIVEMHRGRIWTESRVGRGSKFYFELEKCK